VHLPLGHVVRSPEMQLWLEKLSHRGAVARAPAAVGGAAAFYPHNQAGESAPMHPCVACVGLCVILEHTYAARRLSCYNVAIARGSHRVVI
jgi:hypothetical protein